MFRRIFKLLMRLLILCFVLFIVFYFWGQRANLTPDEQLQLKHYQVPQQEPDSVLTIISWNLGYLSGMTNNTTEHPDRDFFAHNLDSAILMLRGLDADFLALQEIDYNSRRSYFVDHERALAIACGYPYAARVVNWDKVYVPFPYWPPAVHFKKMISGQSILSKYPLSSHEQEILMQPLNQAFYYNAFYIERIVHLVRVDAVAGLVIANVHLEAFDSATRVAQADEVIQYCKPFADSAPFILAGDFNAALPYATSPEAAKNDSTMLKLMNGLNLTEAFSPDSISKNESASFTYSSGALTDKIDHILHNRRIESISARVEQNISASDHLPVIMQFRIKP